MFRISDTVKHLLIINALFFLGSMVMPDVFHRLFDTHFIKNPNFKIWQPITSIFMHGNFLHLALNMFGLVMFATPLEQMWGRAKFLFFYFSCGIGADLLSVGIDYLNFQYYVNQLVGAGFTEQGILDVLATGKYTVAWETIIGDEGLTRMIRPYQKVAMGASGALMGCLAAYGLNFPNAPLSLIFLPVPVKARIFIPIVLGYEILSGLFGGASIFGVNIGHWAHLGGAITGIIMAYYWKKNSFDNTRID